MKAAYINQPGPPESIIVGELPTPQPTGGQVLVKVAAAAVNPIDTYIRSGTVKMDIPLPFIVGCDLAGVVEALGPEAKQFQSRRSSLGIQPRTARSTRNVRRICGRRRSVALSDARRRERRNGRRLRLVSLTAAIRPGPRRQAASRRNTVRQRRHRRRRLDGRANGQGNRRTRHHDGRQRRKGGRVSTLGADLAINYKTEDVPARVHEFAPGGVNVWWETIREPNFDHAIGLLAPRGRMILMAGRDARPLFPVGPFYVKGCQLYGFAMFNATPDESKPPAPTSTAGSPPASSKPRIDRVLPLDQTANRPSPAGRKHRRQGGTFGGEDRRSAVNSSELFTL